MFLYIDIELQREVLAYLDVRSFINLFITCTSLYNLLRLESILPESVTTKIKEKNLVAEMNCWTRLGDFQIHTCNVDPFNGRLIKNTISMGTDTRSIAKGLIPDLHSGYQPLEEIDFGGFTISWDDELLNIIDNLSCITVNKTIFVRLLSEYVKIMDDKNRKFRETIYVYSDRSVLRSRNPGLFGSY